ncbi:MAG TPA: hypothetical protein VFV34_20780 [Blastocatellia bacterium]|nr:hypothetical protein [Blastocatellia bacterium]
MLSFLELIWDLLDLVFLVSSFWRFFASLAIATVVSLAVFAVTQHGDLALLIITGAYVLGAIAGILWELSAKNNRTSAVLERG